VTWGECTSPEDGVDLGAVIRGTTSGTFYSTGTEKAGASASTDPVGTSYRARGGLLVFPAVAGIRTYKLRYADEGPDAMSGGTPQITFSARALRVVTLGF
jgi:hypothetical protein